MAKLIYLDNAATTLHKPKEVQEAVIAAFGQMGNSGRGASEPALKALGTVYDAREALARLFHAENASEIVFTANSTEALNIVIKGILDPGDHVITTAMEHNSVLRPLYACGQTGTEVTILGCDEKGNISYEKLEAAIRENTKAIICTHGSNLTGNLNDAKKIGAIAKKYGVLFVLDVSQTAGHVPVDVQEMQIDVLCFTGHKGLLGPQGTGGMYVRPRVQIRPLKRGGSGIDTYNKNHPPQMPTALEAGTLNGHGIAGLNAALYYIEETGLETIGDLALERMWRFYDGVSRIPGVTVYGDFSKKERCPIVSLNVRDYDSAEVSDELLMTYGITTRPGGHCAPLMHEALGNVEQGAVRFSFSHYNTEAEVEDAIRAIREIAK